MTIAEAGPVGRIKHNFSVMVRGVGFSTLIISSASQSRPLSRLPFPRARFSPSFGFATGTPSLLGIHFHAFSWATRPPLLPPSLPLFCPLLFSRAFTVCFLPYPTTFVALANPLSVSLSFSPSLFLWFFYFLSRALITNFSLFSRNSRSSEQLFRADSGGFSSACSSPSIIYFSSLLSPRNATSLFSFFLYPELASLLTDDTSGSPFLVHAVFVCEAPLRNANIHSRAASAEDREIL